MTLHIIVHMAPPVGQLIEKHTTAVTEHVIYSLHLTAPAAGHITS